MHTRRSQQTLARPARAVGFGYWTGEDITVEFRPAAADAGIVFVRKDLPGQPRIPAVVDRRVDVPRRTSLAHEGGNVEMVEHIMAALAGLHIDNAEVWVDAAEMPGCDGSSLAFVEALQAAGTVELSAPRAALVVREQLRVGDERSWIEASPPRRDASGQELFSVRFVIDYGAETAIGRQECELAINPESFCRELAPARTFLLRQEAEWLQSQGIAQRATAKDLLIFDEQGPIDNALRFENECVRHKALDLVGDLALAGCDVAGHFVAYCSGHRLNAEMARALLRANQSAPRKSA